VLRKVKNLENIAKNICFMSCSDFFILLGCNYLIGSAASMLSSRVDKIWNFDIKLL